MLEFEVQEKLAAHVEQNQVQEIFDETFLEHYRVERAWAGVYKVLPIYIGVHRTNNTISFITPGKVVEATKFDQVTDDMFVAGIAKLKKWIDMAIATAGGFQRASEYEPLETEFPEQEIVPESSPELDAQRQALQAMFNLTTENDNSSEHPEV